MLFTRIKQSLLAAVMATAAVAGTSAFLAGPASAASGCAELQSLLIKLQNYSPCSSVQPLMQKTQYNPDEDDRRSTLGFLRESLETFKKVARERGFDLQAQINRANELLDWALHPLQNLTREKMCMLHRASTDNARSALYDA